MKLVLAEKPSVAQSIAKVLGAAKREDGYLEGNGYVVSWCVGHLVELAQPEVYDAKYSKWAYADLPIFPMDWQYEVSAGTKKQFGILKKLMAREDVASLVCATDAGREGELIFRLVYHKAGCRKPFERLWISSMEDVAIKEGFENLRSGTEYDALYEAALCRERADWIVGINATRLFSTLYGQTLNVGRVMTPTLAMAVMREAAISAFKPELFYTVQIGLDGFTAASERFKTKAAAEAVKQSCSVAIVQKAECKEKTEKPPALYDLTSLQREANRVLGYTAQQTLDYTQNLYEKKLVTYPRTDSRFLTEDMAHSLTDLVKLAFHTFPVEDVDNIPVHAEQVVNNKKVTDHHAIIPTRELQKCNLSELPKGELAILQLISNRLCVAVGDPHRYAETVIELDCGGTVFSTKGKTVVQDGWKALVQKNDSTKSDENVQTLPSVSVGDEMTVSGTEIKEGKTSPPKHFTEDTLLSAMETAGADEMPDEVERKGLGTPATRAGIIEKLVRIGFLERKGDKKTKHLIPTHKGTALVTVMPEQIQSPSMTADWEEKLLLIEKGEYASEDFMDEIKDVIAGLIQNYEVIRDSEVMMSKEANSIGKCPLCGSAVEDKAKAFFCSNRACKFALWKNNRYFASIGKSMTSATAQKLLGSGKVKLKNCKSERTGNTFDATVFMEVSDDGKTKFSMEFENMPSFLFIISVLPSFFLRWEYWW
ncbi:DNA topoisomerase 3 [Gemmiger qucibialis]|nr:DNA topoisomerase 3 [Gemmiger qucibialis]